MAVKDSGENYFTKGIIQSLVESEKHLFCDGNGHLLYSAKLGFPPSEGDCQSQEASEWVWTSTVIYAELKLPRLKYQTEKFRLEVNIS